MSRIRNIRTRARTLFCLAAVLAPGPLAAQADDEAQQPDPFAALEWENVGPDRGGRSIAVAGSDARPHEYFFGATGGGLWKTADGGTTWEAVTDGKIGSASVGSIAVCPSNPDVVYIGTGETQLRGNIQAGDGLYKSTDAGETWEHIGLRAARNFSRLRVHPTNCDIVFAGAFGEYGAENEERGLYRSTDGGETWTRVLYRNAHTGAVDISIDATNPDVIFAALWDAHRKPWTMSSGGEGSGLFKSTDGGSTWTEITRNPGLPQDQLIGKIGVSVSGANPERVYAIIEADSGGVFRSDDGGATWERTNIERKLRQRAFYYTRIYADPQDADRVYVLNTGMYRSDDAGATFDTQIRVPHGDNHDLWIAANDNQRMINANDGGGNVSVNGGRTWTEQDYATAQIYRIGVTAHQPYHVCGGQQDNSTVCVPTRGWDHLTARGGDYFYAPGGCESGYVANDPTQIDIFYAGCYGGALDRFDMSTGQERAVNVWPDNPMDWSAKDLKERVQWTFPIVFSRSGPHTLYTTTQHVWASRNEGQSWEQISPDLTKAEPSTMEASGGPITKDQTGVETYPTIFALAPSPHEADVIWAGTDDGLVQITRNGGATWQNVTPPALPEFTKIFTVEVSPHVPSRAYVAGHRMLLGDYMPYAFRTEDYGQTWTSITNGIPEGDFALTIREDVVQPGLLYLGTEKRVWVSFDNGTSWRSLQQEMPIVQIADIASTREDIAIATHGRSFYIMYDIAPLRQLARMGGNINDVAVLDSPVAERGLDSGVALYYYLPEPAEQIAIEILDQEGNVVRSYEAAASDTASEENQGGGGRFGGNSKPPLKAGLNRFTWDMRYPGFVTFPGMIMWAAGSRGPVALPGEYTVRLTADGVERTGSVTIGIDPRLASEVTPDDLRARFELAQDVIRRVNDANNAVILSRDIKEQVDDRLEQTEHAQIEQVGTRVKTKISEVEGEIYQVKNQSNQDPLNYPIMLNNKLAALLGVIERGEYRPTDQSYEVFEMLSGQLTEELNALNLIIATDLAELNRLLRENGLPEVRAEQTGNVTT